MTFQFKAALSGSRWELSRMRIITLIAALTLGTALTTHAIASEWNKEAKATPVVVADCLPVAASSDALGPRQRNATRR